MTPVPFHGMTGKASISGSIASATCSSLRTMTGFQFMKWDADLAISLNIFMGEISILSIPAAISFPNSSNRARRSFQMLNFI